MAYELNEEFVSSIDKTYTTTFEANDQNQVILRQTLMYYYSYDLRLYNEEKGEYVFGDSNEHGIDGLLAFLDKQIKEI